MHLHKYSVKTVKTFLDTAPVSIFNETASLQIPQTLAF